MFGALTVKMRGALLGVPNTFTASQSTTSVALVSGTNISVNAASSNAFTLALAHNATLGNPTNLRDGMSGMLRIKQPSSGGPFTLAYGSKYKFPASTVPILSTVANSVDVLSWTYWSIDDRLECNMLKAFG